MNLLARIAFWSSLVALALSYLGWPAATAGRALLARRTVPVHAVQPSPPQVTLIVAVHNEAEAIARKVANTLALDYPPGRLQIVVASDGSDDGTPEAAAAAGADRVVVLDLPRQGKNGAINSACAIATGEILVFSDADSSLATNALQALVAPFADPSVGCVGGDFRYRRATGGGGEGQGVYWRLERTLKRLQTRSGTTTAVSGALLALRRELAAPVPPDVTDDFFLMAQALAAGQRVVFAPGAVATGDIAVSLRTEFRRKTRIMTGGLRGVWHMRRLLDPRRHGGIAIQLLFHKVLRRLAVVPLLITLLTSAGLARRGGVYRLVLMGHLVLHGLALAGLGRSARGERPTRAQRLALFYDMTNLAALRALGNVVRGRDHCSRLRSWSPDRAGEAGDPERSPAGP